MAIIVAILGTGCGLMLIESFQDPRWMLARNLILALSVAFGLIPSVHWALVETCTRECLDTFAMALVQMFGFYGLGFLVFMYRIPERFAPGLFDYVGASHQWWHVAVWAAGSAWYEGMVRYYTWRTHSLVCDDHVHTGDAHTYDAAGGWWPHLFTWVRAAYARHWPSVGGGGDL
jgi:predicted membrane channel-forming protein YqfA (hemolysin III family)